MKIKNINIVEMHAEKIALGVAVLFCLGALVYFVVMKPYGAEVRGKKVSVVEAEKLKQNALRDVEQAQNSTTTITMPPVPTFPTAFLEKLKQPLLAYNVFPVPLGNLGIDPSQLEIENQGFFVYEVPKPPTPRLRKTRADYVVLLPRDEMLNRLLALANEPDARPRAELVARHYDAVVAAEPRDTQVVSVAATIDTASWTDELGNAPDDRQLPELRRQIAVTRVELERQERDAQTDEWGPTQTVAIMPGMASALLAEWEQHVEDVGHQDIIELVRREQTELASPKFDDLTTLDRRWLPPNQDVRQLTDEEQRELRRLRDRIRVLRGQIQRLDQGQSAREEEETQPDEMRRRREEKETERAERRRSENDDSGTTTAPSQTLEERRQQQLAAMQEELQKLEAQETELMSVKPAATDSQTTPPASGPLDMRPRGIFPPPPGGGFRPDPRSQPRVTQTPRTIDVWANDLTMEPGKTYRYRVIVHVLNPLYGLPTLGPEQKPEFFNKLSLASRPSEWSEPITTEPTVQYFIVGVDPKAHHVNVEMYRMYGGQRVRQEFTDIGPGEPIGGQAEIYYLGVRRQVPMRVNHLAVNLEERGTQEVFVYLDQTTGLLGERDHDEDLNNPAKIRLYNEWDLSQPLPDALTGPRAER